MVVMIIKALFYSTIVYTFYLRTKVVLRFVIWCACVLWHCGRQVLWLHTQEGRDRLNNSRYIGLS